MQAKTAVKFDETTFARLKRTVKNMTVTDAKRAEDPHYATPVPEEVGIQLTNKCNLRCATCFQWNEEGFLQQRDPKTQNDTIDIELIAQILAATREVRSGLYLWGGEPLCYPYWDRLAKLLVNDPRWTVLCTNGTLIDRKIESLLAVSADLAILVSLDGFAAENDLIRGKGTFRKVVENIDLLLELKRKGLFKGEISINCVINEAMAGKLYEFMEFFEAKGVNTVYFCFPWYLPQDTVERMDRYFGEKFGWLPKMPVGHVPSWHSYQYHLDPGILPVLQSEIAKINRRLWKIRIRFQPALELDEIDDFIRGKEIPAQNRRRCLGLSTRLNVLPSGEVTVCKLFPEFTVGDLKTESLTALWHNEKFTRCRETIGCNLMPVCSKCVLLYLHGI
jgi:sulfatase maturation enzyme AslB (radical SAM superfamily)